MEKGVILNELEMLARKHQTDKQVGDGSIPECHGYTDTYYELFKDHKEDYTDVLELGIWYGASHKMWKEFFVNAEIYGVDNFSGLGHKFRTENPNLTPAEMDKLLWDKIDELREFGISVAPYDQMDREELSRIFEDIYFDLVVDDGGHAGWQQQISFSFLWEHVKPGGYYIIEDLAVAELREFRQHDDIRSSTTYWLRSMLTDEPFSYYMPENVLKKYQAEIEYINFVGELGIIKKNG
jgi:demethylmacrocin O-methyltransferase